MTKNIGEMLKDMRENKNLSVGQLAMYSGVSRPYLYEIENGIKCPSPKILLKLSKTLGVSHEQLVQLSLLSKQRRTS